MKSQPRLKTGKRIPRGSSLEKKIDNAVTVASKHFGVSKSWIVSVALADFFKIKIERFD